jgi:hypothetical protein
MGVLFSTAKFLLTCSRTGACFRRTLTIGRQNLYVDEQDFQDLFLQHPLSAGTRDPEALRRAHGESEYVEPFLKLLGAEEVASLDASAYEGATVVHDLNRPIPDDLKGRFDVVFDAGSLEHVFSFPVAVRNCMEMVRVGGHLLLNTPANNQCGHGFYQFSPELFYRVLCPANGFRVEQLILYEEFAGGQWYEVADPSAVKSRVEYFSCVPMMMLVRARRTHPADLFADTPQQSDYVPLWTGEKAPRRAERKTAGLRPLAGKALARLAPGFTRWLRRSLYSRRLGRCAYQSSQGVPFFKPIDGWGVGGQRAAPPGTAPG